MRETIEKIWRKQLQPYEKCGSNNEEIKALERLLQRNCEKLEKALSEKEKETLEKYNDCCNEYVDLMMEQAFCDGFCLGARIVAEAIAGTN